jgi:hypothetical protein
MDHGFFCRIRGVEGKQTVRARSDDLLTFSEEAQRRSDAA